MRLIHLLILLVSMALLAGCPSGGGDAAAPAAGEEAPKKEAPKADDKKEGEMQRRFRQRFAL